MYYLLIVVSSPDRNSISIILTCVAFLVPGDDHDETDGQLDDNVDQNAFRRHIAIAMIAISYPDERNTQNGNSTDHHNRPVCRWTMTLDSGLATAAVHVGLFIICIYQQARHLIRIRKSQRNNGSMHANCHFSSSNSRGNYTRLLSASSGGSAFVIVDLIY